MFEYGKKKSEEELISDLLFSIQFSTITEEKESLDSTDIDRLVIGIIGCSKSLNNAFYCESYEKIKYMKESKIEFWDNLVKKFDEDTLYNIVLRLESVDELSSQDMKAYSNSIRKTLYTNIISNMSEEEKDICPSCNIPDINMIYNKAIFLPRRNGVPKKKFEELSKEIFSSCSLNMINNLIDKLKVYYDSTAASVSSIRRIFIKEIFSSIENENINRVVDEYFDKKNAKGPKKIQ